MVVDEYIIHHVGLGILSPYSDAVAFQTIIEDTFLDLQHGLLMHHIIQKRSGLQISIRRNPIGEEEGTNGNENDQDDKWSHDTQQTQS